MPLDKYREEIDDIDRQLVELLIKRIDCSQKIGLYKKEHHLAVFDLSREEAIVQEKIRLFAEKGLDDPSFVRKLYVVIFDKSREMQK